MIIDCHAYVLGSSDLYRQKANLLAERGWGDSARPPDPAAVSRYGDETVRIMDRSGVDVRLIAPRPYHTMLAEKPAQMVQRWTRMCNDVIAAQCRQHPTRLRGIGGLPQPIDGPIDACFAELERCAEELGFVGVMLNPDPSEGLVRSPGMGDPYWYPLYARLEALDMPALIVGGATRQPRQTYRTHYITESSIAVLSLLENRALFERFPRLKLVITYGAGSIPYQVGRWRARCLRRGDADSFDEQLRRLWFDTVVHSPEAMDLLLQVCGPDRCLYGTTEPGAASTTDPRTGRPFDQLIPLVEGVSWLTAAQRSAIFEGNARQVFSRL